MKFVMQERSQCWHLTPGALLLTSHSLKELSFPWKCNLSQKKEIIRMPWIRPVMWVIEEACTSKPTPHIFKLYYLVEWLPNLLLCMQTHWLFIPPVFGNARKFICVSQQLTKWNSSLKEFFLLFFVFFSSLVLFHHLISLLSIECNFLRWLQILAELQIW